MYTAPIVRLCASFCLLLCCLCACSRPAAALTPTAFSYTGQLLVGGSPVSGSYDLQFQLYTVTSGGTQVGPTVTLTSVPVADGIFYAELNFGTGVYTGQALYLQTSYRLHGGSAYITQSPRKLVPTAGYVDYAPLAGYAFNSATTSRLQSVPISATAPTTGQALTFDGSKWSPATPSGGFSLPYSGSASSSSTAFAVVNSGGDGIKSTSTGNDGTGVTGIANSGANANGVYGASSNGFGVVGNGGVTGVTGTNLKTGDSGSLGSTISHNSAIVDVGVSGSDVLAPTHFGFGVYGNSVNYIGVGGKSTGDNNASGTDAVGVEGDSSASGDDQNGNGIGVLGASGSGNGVYGFSNSSNGVYGFSNSGTGIFANNHGAGLANPTLLVNNGSSAGIGIYAATNSNDATMVLSNAGSGDLIKAFNGGNVNFEVTAGGDVTIAGTLTAATKHFRIDDPLDPAGKYLVHASIESNEMKDIYDGNITLSSHGTAWVQMPHWFQALNKDFRYQLTAVDAPGPNLYIAHKVIGNKFEIAGGKPGAEVSWMVTGVREDAFAKAHPMQVEEVKPVGERGLYLDPIAQGKPVSMGIGYAQQQKMQAKN